MPDNLTPQQRSRCMSHVKGKDTLLEQVVCARLHKIGYRFRKHVKQLPGKPDIVFYKARVAVFIDGDFWHGYRFPTWEHKLSDFWKVKINKNRGRDRRNFRRLHAMGWRVVRLWQHQILYDIDSCIEKITSILPQKGV